MICIYIRSLDQARGLLAQGMLVFASVVSSDSQHVSSGNLCTACIRQLSLSTSKLSCLSIFLTLHLFLFFQSLFLSLSLCVISTVTVIFSLRTISAALQYLCCYTSVHISIFCQFNVDVTSSTGRAQE